MADCLGDGRHAAAAWLASHLPATDESPVPAPKENDRRLVPAVAFSTQKFSPSCEGNGCQARVRRRRRTITVVTLNASSAHVEGSGTAVKVSVPSSSNWAD